MQTGPWEKYKAMRSGGKLQVDADQEALALQLQALYDRLLNYHPEKKPGIAGAIARWRAGNPPRPKGLYIHGPVGRGKSMLMDLFFHSATTPQKKRVHFHAFMQDVHHRLFIMHQTRPDTEEPLKVLAAELIKEAWLLCFDEFVVQDISDAMILSRLFTALFDAGMVIVATSNVAPDDLYKNGLHRERFLPFIPILKQHADIVAFAAGTDYRTKRIAEMNLYNAPIDAKSEAALALAFAQLTDHEDAPPEALKVKGHELIIQRAAKGVAFCKFAELCGKNYGAADYLAIAEKFHTLILSGIPQFTIDRRDESKRFITLIDVLYDNHIKLICSAAVVPQRLCPPGGPNADEFARTVSRLQEMGSREYMEAIKKSEPEKKVSA